MAYQSEWMNQEILDKYDEFFQECVKILDISFARLRKAEKIENHLDKEEEIYKILDYAASINAIRSIFDRIMWEVADPKIRISKRNKIKFPIFYTQSSFVNWWKQVEDLYENLDGIKEFLDRSQPYNILPQSESDIKNIKDYIKDKSAIGKFTFILSSFDNSSKHRILLERDRNISKSRSSFNEESDEDQYSFVVKDYNSQGREFIVSSPWYPEASILHPGYYIIYVIATKSFTSSYKKDGEGFDIKPSI